MKNLQIELGCKVRHLRNESGHSQESFASLADIDRTYIADIEAGKRNISLEVLSRLASALGLSLAELLEGIGERPIK
jgi:transcriptional regulator with XRE-family HTH domain